jgi:hypothetical protein
MLEFGDSAYYIDLKALDKIITLTSGKDDFSSECEEKQTTNENGKIITKEIYTKTSPKPKEVDAMKYDLLRTLIDYIIDFDELSDDTLGAERAFLQTPFSFKLAFNTLYNEGIIKEKK